MLFSEKCTTLSRVFTGKKGTSTNYCLWATHYAIHKNVEAFSFKEGAVCDQDPETFPSSLGQSLNKIELKQSMKMFCGQTNWNLKFFNVNHSKACQAHKVVSITESCLFLCSAESLEIRFIQDCCRSLTVLIDIFLSGSWYPVRLLWNI